MRVYFTDIAPAPCSNDRRLLSLFGNLQAPNVLTSWLKKPTEDWNLAYRMLDHVKDMVNK